METVSITGIAKNAKLGAVVLSNDSTYYVEGLDRWDFSYLDKEVRVKGELDHIEWDEEGSEEIVAKGSGTWMVIKNAKYSLTAY